MIFTPKNLGQAKAFRISLYLRKKSAFWTKDSNPCVMWSDDGDRAAYQLICQTAGVPIEA